MIHILSWTTKNHQKTLSMQLNSKLKKTKGLFKDLHRNLRTFQGKMLFKDFSRTSPKIQGLFKTVQTCTNFWLVSLRTQSESNSSFHTLSCDFCCSCHVFQTCCSLAISSTQNMKFSAIFTTPTKTTELTQPCPHVFFGAIPFSCESMF